jgi:hypothetical protein
MPHEITVTLCTYGIEHIDGRRVRKIAGANVPYFERIGWTLALRVGESSYARMYPPAGSDIKRPSIQLIVPTEAEIMVLALQIHAGRLPWRGELCGWPARYTPHKVERGRRALLTVFGEGPRERIEPYKRIDPAEFQVGKTGDPWNATVIWHDGDDQPPDLIVHTD